MKKKKKVVTETVPVMLLDDLMSLKLCDSGSFLLDSSAFDLFATFVHFCLSRLTEHTFTAFRPSPSVLHRTHYGLSISENCRQVLKASDLHHIQNTHYQYYVNNNEQ